MKKRDIGSYFINLAYLAILCFAALFMACKGPQQKGKGGSEGSIDTEKTNFTVKFSVSDAAGASIAATKKDGSVISTNAKVEKGEEVTFTLTLNDGYSIEEWKLNNNKIDTNKITVADKKHTYKTTVNENINLVVKIKKDNGGSGGEGEKLKFDIKKVVLGYINLEGQGRTLERSALNENVVLDDMEVDGDKFPILIQHNKKFGIEKIDIKVNGENFEENPEMSDTLYRWSLNLSENVKTAIKITIKADPMAPDADKYEKINISLNVTYKKPEINKLIGVRIGITHNSKNTKTTYYEQSALAIYPNVSKKLSLLDDGNEVLNVASATPKLTITLPKSEEQAKAVVKLGENDLGLNFEEGKTKIETTLPTLNKGDENLLTITLTKEDKTGKVHYEKKTYRLKLNYKPLLSLKNLVINGKRYDAPIPSSIEIAHDAQSPITLSGEAKETGAIVKFSKFIAATKKWEALPSSNIVIEQGQSEKLKYELSLEGYTGKWDSFTITRKAEEKFTVKYSVEGDVGGTLTAKIQNGNSFNTDEKIDKGTNIELTATPQAGYVLDKWIVDKADIDCNTLTYTHTVNAECEIKVKFKQLVIKIKSVSINQTSCEKDSIVDVATDSIEAIVIIKDGDGKSYTGSDLKAYINNIAETQALGDLHYCTLQNLTEGETNISITAKIGDAVKDTFNFKVNYTKPSVVINEITAEDNKKAIWSVDKYTVELGDKAIKFTKLKMTITPLPSQDVSKFKLVVKKGSDVYVANGKFTTSNSNLVCEIAKPDSKPDFDLHEDTNVGQYIEIYTLDLYYNDNVIKTITLKANGKYT